MTRPLFFRRDRKGFTLVETGLALGIVGFALVAIIGMIPVAVDNARESRLQTRAAFIGRFIFDNLLSGADGKVVVQTKNTGKDSDYAIVELSPGLARKFTMSFDESGNLLDFSGDFESGQDMPLACMFVAQLTLTRNAGEPAVAEVSVETPAVAERSQRKKYLFVSRLVP